MKVLVVYDSLYGNTEKIAQSIGRAIGGGVKVLRAGVADPAELKKADLVIIGSPTQGGRTTLAIQDFIAKITESSIKGVNVATFDTRLSTKFVGIFGYAAGRIASDLKNKGADLAAPPEGFFVKDSKGPLKDGELERAAIWANGILECRQ